MMTDGNELYILLRIVNFHAVASCTPGCGPAHAGAGRKKPAMSAAPSGCCRNLEPTTLGAMAAGTAAAWHRAATRLSPGFEADNVRTSAHSTSYQTTKARLVRL